MPTISDLAVPWQGDNDHMSAETGKAIKDRLDEFGAVLVRGLIPTQALDRLKLEIKQLIDIRKELETSAVEPDRDGVSRFDDDFVGLNQCSREHGGVIYRAGRRLFGNNIIATHPRLVGVSRSLLGDLLMLSEDRSIRIDHPNEDKYLFPWHQDYPFNMDSDDALVFWIPLHDVNEQNGALCLAIGSHRQGIFPVRVVDSGNQNQNRAKAIELADEAVLEKFEKITVPVQVGDALLFSAMLLHRSTANVSSRARWTLQVRVGNYRDAGAIARGWPAAMASNPFEQVHPEAVVN